MISLLLDCLSADCHSTAGLWLVEILNTTLASFLVPLMFHFHLIVSFMLRNGFFSSTFVSSLAPQNVLKAFEVIR